MFAAVELTAPEKVGFLQRLKWPGLAGRIKIEKRNANGAAYFLLKLPAGRKGPDLTKLKSASGREYSRLLLPEELSLPEDSPVGRYDDSGFMQRLCLNGMLAVAGMSGIPAARLSVTLCDPAGRCFDTACGLLRYFACVFVVTAQKERYTRLNEYAMSKYGAGFILLSPPCTLPVCHAVFAPFGARDCDFSPYQPVFSPKELSSVFWVSSRDVILPEPYLSALPSGISPGVFAAALAEKTGKTELYGLLPPFFIRGGRKFSLSETARHLMTLDTGRGGGYNSFISENTSAERPSLKK